MASSRKPAPTDALAAVAAFLQQHALAGKRICVGFSGGLDSTVLLDALHALRAEYSLELGALHVNHGLSPDAGRWQQHCADFCAARCIAFEARSVSLGPKPPQGLEAAARSARHEQFRACTADWIALGHHRDDQAETVLFRLLRGSGLRGAAAMVALERRADGLALMRPLLALRREALLAHARQQGLDWVEDGSNREQRHARNFLRHAVLPLIRQRFPAAPDSLARAAAHFRDSLNLTDALAELDWKAAGGDATVSSAGVLGLDPARQRNLLRWRLHALGLAMPQEARLQEALRQLARVLEERPLRVLLGEGELCQFGGRVWVQPKLPEQRAAELPWRGEAEVAWGGGRLVLTPCDEGGIDPALAGRVVVAGVRGGARLRPHPNRPSRSLKNLFQEAGVPPWIRSRLPTLSVDGELLWVAEIGMDANSRRLPGLQPRWLPPSDVPSRVPRAGPRGCAAR